MRVLFVHNRYRSASPSGEDRVVDREVAALAARGHAVERFERASDDIARRSRAGKALVPAQVIWSDSARRALRAQLRTFRPDVVHVHNTFPLVSASVLYACRSERVPVVVTVHNYRLVCPSGDLFRDGAPCHDCVDRRVPIPGVVHGCYRGSVAATLPLAAGLVANRTAWRRLVSAYIFLSQAQLELVARAGLPEARLFVKPNFAHDPPVAGGQRNSLVVYAGRLTTAKGVDLLMDAWDRYVGAGGDTTLRLAVAGAGPLEERVATWAASRSSVEWLGMLDGATCASLVATARAVVVPSEWEETFGLIAVEAMAAGVPPIAPRRGSFPEIVTDGTDGVLYPPGDADALAKVFLDVDHQPDRFDRLGHAARDTHRRRFSEDTNVDQLVGIYRYAIEHPVH